MFVCVCVCRERERETETETETEAEIKNLLTEVYEQIPWLLPKFRFNAFLPL